MNLVWLTKVRTKHLGYCAPFLSFSNILTFHLFLACNNMLNQECIPVGCLSSAGLAVGGGGACLGGVCPGGVCLGVSAPVHAGIHSPLVRHGGGVCPSTCWDTHPPVHRILDTRLWKHYLSATSFADGKYAMLLLFLFIQRPKRRLQYPIDVIKDISAKFVIENLTA